MKILVSLPWLCFLSRISFSQAREYYIPDGDRLDPVASYGEDNSNLSYTDNFGYMESIYSPTNELYPTAYLRVSVLPRQKKRMFDNLVVTPELRLINTSYTGISSPLLASLKPFDAKKPTHMWFDSVRRKVLIDPGPLNLNEPFLFDIEPYEGDFSSNFGPMQFHRSFFIQNFQYAYDPNGNGLFMKRADFGGWFACFWNHNYPQLFWYKRGVKAPALCEKLKLFFVCLEGSQHKNCYSTTSSS